jgi:hypothetical protein
MKARFASFAMILALTAPLGCAARNGGINHHRPRGNEPSKIGVFLHKTPDGGCVSVTLPQVVWVYSGDRVRWDVVNTCGGDEVVELEFAKKIIDFDKIDKFEEQATASEETGRDRRPSRRTKYEPRGDKGGAVSPPFESRAEGKASGTPGEYVKYKIKINGTVVEDPGVGFWPPAR